MGIENRPMYRKAVVVLVILVFWFGRAGAQYTFDVPQSTVKKFIDGTEYYIHTVEKGQTVYKISKSYGITPEDLIRLNPAIMDGLRVKQELLIPTGRKEDRPPAPVKTDTVKVRPPEANTPVMKEPDPYKGKSSGTDVSVRKDVYDVALLMHFFLDEADRIDVGDPPEDPERTYRPFHFIQFYEGFLMAVDSLKKEGLSVRIHVYDLGTDTNQTKIFLAKNDLKKMDMVIALLYHRNFQIVAKYTDQYRIPLVSPVSERESQVTGHPSVIKVRPAAGSMLPSVADMISARYPGSNVVIVRNPQSVLDTQAVQLKNLLEERGVTPVLTESRMMTKSLSKDTSNIVAIFSDTKPAILNLLTQLNGVKQQYSIRVFGLPDWGDIDGLEVDYLVNLRTHIISSHFIDYEDHDIRNFVSNFQEKIRTDPSDIAFLGFDIARYFLSALMKYGTKFPESMNGMDIRLLLAPYRFEREAEQVGYENQKWVIYYYENYRMYDASVY